jgi:phosphoribosyl 1,2-cyclic phosphodiesterase
MILLTHKHGDHFDRSTIIRVGREYPNIILVIPEHMVEEVKELNYAGRTFVIEENKKYKYGSILLEPVKLFHDVPNVGYKIITTDGFKLIHCTDTGSISHVNAKNFDIYAIEHNYVEADVDEKIKKKINDGIFAYEVRAKENHLSFDQASSWIESQRKNSSVIIKLHISSLYLE